jgi:hypothetical protein
MGAPARSTLTLAVAALLVAGCRDGSILHKLADAVEYTDPAHTCPYTGPVTVRTFVGARSGGALDRARAEFSTAARAALTTIDFDDVAVGHDQLAPFDADRYRQKGISIRGTGGQYAISRLWMPAWYAPETPPNMYSPGPPAAADAVPVSGGHATNVTFRAGEAPGCTAAFAATLLDVDYPDLGPSGFTVYDGAGRALHGAIGAPDGVTGGDLEPVFLGMVALDGQGNPVPAIARVYLENGNAWPGVSRGEGAMLDDFLFTAPIP